MNNQEEYEDDDFEGPRLFAYVTGEELLAELKATEANGAAPDERRAMSFSWTTVVVLTASLFAALAAAFFAG
ncbi:MAG: hypothetical protein ABIS92_17860 [Polyangia bacterium]